MHDGQSLLSVDSSGAARRYGWKPDLYDSRDHVFAAPRFQTVPASVDLRPGCPAVYDQGPLGSCTANAICGALQFDEIKQGLPSVPRSRLFVYYNERSLEGTINSDAGAAIRDGIKSVGTDGACTEDSWPYVVGQFATRPPQVCYDGAKSFLALQYSAVQQTLIGLKTALASGNVIIFGFTVYSSFESAAVAKSGIMPIPRQNEAVLGGHAVDMVGYDDADQTFLCRNSWGKDWGMAGYFKMPYSYATSKYSSDFWVITTVSGSPVPTPPAPSAGVMLQLPGPAKVFFPGATIVPN